jgi:hypothetical protein
LDSECFFIHQRLKSDFDLFKPLEAAGSKTLSNDREPWIDKDGLRREMTSWERPIHFVGFETFALPFHSPKVAAREVVAFQFS